MTKKEIVENFLKLAASGHPHEAFRLYVGKNFRHLNIHFKGDAQTLMLAMEESARKNPNKILKIHHIIACLLYTSPSPRDQRGSRMPSSA